MFLLVGVVSPRLSVSDGTCRFTVGYCFRRLFPSKRYLPIPSPAKPCDVPFHLLPISSPKKIRTKGKPTTKERETRDAPSTSGEGQFSYCCPPPQRAAQFLFCTTSNVGTVSAVSTPFLFHPHSASASGGVGPVAIVEDFAPFVAHRHIVQIAFYYFIHGLGNEHVPGKRVRAYLGLPLAEEGSAAGGLMLWNHELMPRDYETRPFCCETCWGRRTER